MAPTPTEDERTVVYLGNRKAIEVLDDPDDLEAAAAEGRAVNRIRRPMPRAKRCTTIILAPGLSLVDAMAEITNPTRGVWQAHSNADAPAWVASTNPALASFLAAHWQCELRDQDPGHARDRKSVV